MMELLKPRPTAKTFVLDAESRLLIIRRSLLVMYGRGRYDLPGGTIKPGEEPIDAAIREAKEETGLELAQAGLRQLGVLDNHTLFVYHLDELQPKIVTGWEHYKRPVWPYLERADEYLRRQPYAAALGQLIRDEVQADYWLDAA